MSVIVRTHTKFIYPEEDTTCNDYSFLYNQICIDDLRNEISMLLKKYKNNQKVQKVVSNYALYTPNLDYLHELVYKEVKLIRKIFILLSNNLDHLKSREDRFAFILEKGVSGFYLYKEDLLKLFERLEYLICYYDIKYTENKYYKLYKKIYKKSKKGLKYAEIVINKFKIQNIWYC